MSENEPKPTVELAKQTGLLKTTTQSQGTQKSQKRRDNNPKDYDSARTYIINHTKHKPKLTDFPHTILFNLLRKALFGLSFYQGNLVLSIQPFYDLTGLSTKYKRSSIPCNAKGTNEKCACIIGYLIQQQVFVNVERSQQKKETEQVQGDIKNSIQGKVIVSVGKSVADNVMNFNLSAKNQKEKSQKKRYSIKKHTYIYGIIILKNNIFTTEFLRSQVTKLKEILIEEKQNAKNSNQQGENLNSKQQAIIQEFCDEFGDVIPTKCQIGIYAAQYDQQAVTNQSDKSNLGIDTKASTYFSTTVNTNKDQSSKNSNHIENFTTVLDPTIIRRQNYISTNTLAEVYDQSEVTYVKYNLQSKLFLLLGSNTARKEIINMNSNQLAFSTLPYNQRNEEINRLYTIGFYNVEVKNETKSKYKVTCILRNRKLTANCQLFIRKQVNQKSELKYYEVDQFLIDNTQKTDKKLDNFLYLSYEEFSQECSLFQFWKNDRQTKIELKFTEQTNSFFELKVFETQNDKVIRRGNQKKRNKTNTVQNSDPDGKKKMLETNTKPIESEKEKEKEKK